MVLRWPDESFAKGYSHGKAALHLQDYGPSGAAQCRFRKGSKYFVNTSAAEVEEHMAPLRREPAAVDTAAPVCLKSFSLMVPPYDEALVSFFDSVICSTSTFIDSAKHNPYREIFMPLALRSPGALSAIQAIAARILALRESRFDNAAMRYYSRTLGHLITVIDGVQTDDSTLEEACALTVLLCWFEVGLPRSGNGDD